MTEELRSIDRNGQMFFWNEIRPSVRKDEDSVGVFNIDSDDGGRFELGIYTHQAIFGDVFIDMDDKVFDENHTTLRGIRLRGLIGGGNNPFITEAFGSILHYFNHGMVEELRTKTREKDRLNPATGIQIKKNEDENTKLSIIGIRDDDRRPVFLDILVLKTGDVKLRTRFYIYLDDYDDPDETSEVRTGEMLFKTRENGGQHPFVAETLSKLAQRIAKASKNNL